MARRPPKRSHPTTRYAQDVVDGRIVAGPLVRLASARHLHDLQEGHKRGLYFDTDEADANFEFFEECLVHPEGKLEGEPFRLLPFQKFQHGNIFGWYGPEGRRYRIVYDEEAKGSGKSPRGSGNALYCLIVDGGNASQIYCAAFSAQQAISVGWTDCMNLAKASPKIDRLVEYNRHTHRIIYQNSFIGVLSSEHRGASGQRVKMAFVDELHEHPKPDLLHRIQKGTKSVKDPLIFITTNSGVDRHSICFHYHDWSERVLRASVPGGDPAFADDQLFAYVCALDAEDYEEKAKDKQEGTQRVQVSLAKIAAKPETWEKANPGIDTILDRQYLEKEVKQALNMPASQNITLRLNFCVWTDSVSVWIPDNIWMAGVAPGRNLEEELTGEACIAGLDLGRTRDLSALVLLFPPSESRRLWAFLEFYWCPEWDIRERSEKDRIPYQQWAKEGHMRVTDGNVIDFAVIKRDALVLAEKYLVREWVYDRYFATQTVTELGQEGFTMVGIGQGSTSMNAPICEIERLVCAAPSMIEHRGHPVTRWNMGNVVLAGDKHGGFSIDKERSREKVDGAQALANAMARAMLVYGEHSDSVYDQRLKAGEPVLTSF